MHNNEEWWALHREPAYLLELKKSMMQLQDRSRQLCHTISAFVVKEEGSRELFLALKKDRIKEMNFQNIKVATVMAIAMDFVCKGGSHWECATLHASQGPSKLKLMPNLKDRRDLCIHTRVEPVMPQGCL